MKRTLLSAAVALAALLFSTPCKAATQCTDVSGGQTLAQAVANSLPGGCVSIVPGTWPVDANLTIPTNVTLNIFSGGILAISPGVTLTINGPFNAPNVQVFQYTVPATSTITATSEVGSTATYTGTNNFGSGQSILIQNVTVAGYNTFCVLSQAGSASFKCDPGNAGLGASSGGIAQALPVTFSTTSAGWGLVESWFPGNDIGARINAAFSALPTYQKLPNNVFESSPMFNGSVLIGETGKVTVSTIIEVRSHRVKLIGPGRSLLELNSSLTGTAIRITDNVFGNYDNGAEVRGLSVYAVSPGANSVGITAGDMWGLRLSDITVDGFTGASGSGIWFNNCQLVTNCSVIGVNAGFIENGNFTDINLRNNTNGWRFSDNTNAGNCCFSYGYNHWYRIQEFIPTNGVGIQVDGGSTNLFIIPTVYHSTILQWTFEPVDGTTTNFTGINLAANALFADNTYAMYAENTFGGPNITPIALGANSALTGSGTMEFFTSTGISYASPTSSIFNVEGRVVFTGATLCVLCNAANYTVSAGWGSTSSIQQVDGAYNAMRFRVGATGVGQAANPTVTLNFPATNHTTPFLPWRTPPEIQCVMMGSGNVANPQAFLQTNNTQTTTSATITALFTPVAGGLYDIQCSLKSR